MLRRLSSGADAGDPKKESDKPPSVERSPWGSFVRSGYVESMVYAENERMRKAAQEDSQGKDDILRNGPRGSFQCVVTKNNNHSK